MRTSRRLRTPQAGFTLIEVIVSLVVGAINIARAEGAAEMWMERIISDYVQEMNTPVSYSTALATIFARDYTIGPYNMPASVTLTRTCVTYDGAGDEVTVTCGGTSTNLKVTVQAGGYGLTSILTAERVTSGDPITYY